MDPRLSYYLAILKQPLNPLSMKHLLLLCSMVGLSCLNAQPAQVDPATWDLVRTYETATHVFYGELTKVIPEPKFKTGVMGVDVDNIDESPLPLQEIVWPKAKHLTFTVEENFKEMATDELIAYHPDHDRHLWIYLQNDSHDTFLAQSEEPDPIFEKLNPGDKALIFFRFYLGSNIPIVYRARLGQHAEDDLALLRAYKSNSNVSLAAICHQAHIEQQAKAKREAEAFTAFEDEYYKILRTQDLTIRQSLLKDLVIRLGFEGRWEYFEYKERYLKKYGAYHDNGAEPPQPDTGNEKLWKDISQELNKIDVILKARASQR